MKLFAKALAAIGAFVAATASAGCIIVYFDEPEMPESMLK
jgi:cyclic lactone autoinducer peptide